MNFLTRIFQRRTSDEIIQELSAKIILCGLEYRATIQEYSDKISANVGAEIIYLLLHEIDRIAFDIFYAVPKQHEKVMKLLTYKTITDYTRTVLKKGMSIAFTTNLGLSMIKDFNNRHIEIYSRCRTLVGEKRSPYPSTGTRIFALGYFIHRALGKTPEKNVDDILVGKQEITREDVTTFPDFTELIKLQVEIMSSLVTMKVKENLQKLLTAK